MDRKLDLKVGQEVAVKIENTSNASRYVDMGIDNIDKWCFDGIVTKVGKKYITVKFDGWEKQFVVEDDYREKWTAGGADYKLYLNKQEVIDEYESNWLYSKIQDNLSGYIKPNLSLNQLKRIWDIIQENNK